MPASVPYEIGLHARLRDPSYAAAYFAAAALDPELVILAAVYLLNIYAANALKRQIEALPEPD